MVRVRNDQSPSWHVVGGEVHVSLLLGGDVGPEWRGAFNQLARKQGVRAWATVHGSAAGAGDEPPDVLVVGLPADVDAHDAETMLDEAEWLVRQVPRKRERKAPHDREDRAARDRKGRAGRDEHAALIIPGWWRSRAPGEANLRSAEA
jgi:hypothetical protein